MVNTDKKSSTQLVPPNIPPDPVPVILGSPPIPNPNPQSQAAPNTGAAPPNKDNK